MKIYQSLDLCVMSVVHKNGLTRHVNVWMETEVARTVKLENVMSLAHDLTVTGVYNPMMTGEGGGII